MPDSFCVRHVLPIEALSVNAEQLGDYEAAKRYTAQAMKTGPNVDDMLRSARYEERLGKSKAAKEWLHRVERSTATGRQLELAYAEEAYLALNEGDSGRAEVAFEGAARLNPSEVRWPAALAQLYFDDQKFSEAAAKVNAIPARQRTLTLWFLLAEANSSLRNWNLARNAFGESLPLTEGQPEARARVYTSMAYLEERLFEKGRAAEHFQAAFEAGNKTRPQLLAFAAKDFYDAGQFQQSASNYLDFLAQGGITVNEKAGALQSLSDAYGQLGDVPSAIRALRKAINAGANTGLNCRRLAYWHFSQKDFDSALLQFRAAAEESKQAADLFGIGRCYEKLGKPGLAAHFLRAGLEASDAPSGLARLSVLGELSEIHEELGEYAQAAQALRQSTSLDDRVGTSLQLVAALRLAGDYKSARTAYDRIPAEKCTHEERISYLDQGAALLEHEGNLRGALANFLEANKASAMAWRSYKAGLLYLNLGESNEGLEQLRTAVGQDESNIEVRATFAYALQKNGRLEDAAGQFSELAARQTANASWSKAAAYLNLRLGNNAKAADFFRQALDASARQPGEERASANYAIRSEVARLTKKYDVTLYQGVNSTADPRNGSLYLFNATPFPNSTGLEFAYQMPKIGLRNGRQLQVFTRLLWSDGNRILRFDPAYYQMSVGIRYKPIARQNLWLSAERLIHTGLPDYKGWLFRGLYSWTRGYEMQPAKPRWNYTVAFSDTSFVPGTKPFLAEYIEARRGVTFNIRNSVLFTPHVVADGRWQSAQTNARHYIEYGAGVSIRYLFNQNRYEAPRSSFETVFQCKRGNVGPVTLTSAAAVNYASCSALAVFRF